MHSNVREEGQHRTLCCIDLVQSLIKLQDLALLVPDVGLCTSEESCMSYFIEFIPNRSIKELRCNPTSPHLNHHKRSWYGTQVYCEVYGKCRARNQ